MFNGIKRFAASALVAAALGAASSAGAVTIIPISSGPFSLPGNPSGVIPAGVIATTKAAANPYDFTFTTVGHTYETLMQMQGSNLKGKPQNIAFALYQGVPGSGTFVGDSAGTSTAATLITLTAGTYYMQVDKINAPKELITGGVTLLRAVPEPATWAMMMLGLGGVGAMLRRRREAHNLFTA